MTDIDYTPSESENAISDTVVIVGAYVSRNSVPVAELPGLIKSVHAARAALSQPAATTVAASDAPLVPAVPIKKSITDDYLISLENGQKFKSLKRHLMTSYGMTPADYRKRWGLADDYPMVAPAYSKARSALAKDLGLGRKAEPRVVQ